MIYKCYAICGPGLVRAENQDNLFINGIYRRDVTDNSLFRYGATLSDSGLFAVADGMGGEKHGELASLIAVQALENAETSANGMVRYLIERNDAICDLITAKGGARIGSTFAGVYLTGDNADIVNIGDSRVYLHRTGELAQLSCDHTSTQRMIDMGLLDKAAASKHSDRHKLTQHLGVFPSEFIIEPCTVHVSIQAGDVFLMCSDGLTDMLDDQKINDTLNMQGSVAEWAESLYAEAMQNGGKDNITIVLIQAEGKAAAASGRAKGKAPASSRTRKYSKKYIVISICAIAAALLSVVILIITLNRNSLEKSDGITATSELSPSKQGSQEDNEGDSLKNNTPPSTSTASASTDLPVASPTSIPTPTTTPTPTPTTTSTPMPTPKLSPEPTATKADPPSPLPPQVQSVVITYEGTVTQDFSESVGTKIPLQARWEPDGINPNEPVEWESSDTSIFTVKADNPEGTDATVTITGVGTATLIASVGGESAVCIVRANP